MSDFQGTVPRYTNTSPSFIQMIIDRLRGTNPDLVHPEVIGHTGMAQDAAQALKNRKAALDAQIAAAGG